MAERKDFQTHDESVMDCNFADLSDNHSKKNNLNGDTSEDLKGNHSLLDVEFEKYEYDSAQASTSYVLQEELRLDYEGTLHETELQLAEEIAETAAETVRDKLQYIHHKCVVCSDNLNAFFQLVLHELKRASMSKNWNRVAKLHDIFTNSEPYYRPVLLIIESIEEITKTVEQHGYCLSKCILNKVIRMCNALENILVKIVLSVPKLND